MTSIQHLSPQDQVHFILCDCGHYIDMRNLSQIFEHMHAALPKPEWAYSIKKDEPAAYFKSGEKIGLN